MRGPRNKTLVVCGRSRLSFCAGRQAPRTRWVRQGAEKHPQRPAVKNPCRAGAAMHGRGAMPRRHRGGRAPLRWIAPAVRAAMAQRLSHRYGSLAKEMPSPDSVWRGHLLCQGAAPVGQPLGHASLHGFRNPRPPRAMAPRRCMRRGMAAPGFWERMNSAVNEGLNAQLILYGLGLRNGLLGVSYSILCLWGRVRAAD